MMRNNCHFNFKQKCHLNTELFTKQLMMFFGMIGILLGINDVAPRDEYKDYTPIIFTLKLNEASKETIAKKLYEIETEIIGLSGNRIHGDQVAEKIITLGLDT